MSNLTELVPPLELCKLIPAGEFAESVHWYRWSYIDQKYFVVEGKPDVRFYQDPCPCGMKYFYPAPTLQEIIEELHKHQEDVFLKWSENAYHEWLVNAYTHGRNEDYQAHDKNIATAALKVWLQMKGIEYEQKQS